MVIYSKTDTMASKNKPISVNPDGLIAPESWNLECQVLADLIVNPDIIPTARGIVNRSVFSVEAFQRAWDTINDMTDQGMQRHPIEPSTGPVFHCFHRSFAPD